MRVFLFCLGIALILAILPRWLLAQTYIHGGDIGYGQNNPAPNPTLSHGQSYPLRMDALGDLIVVTPTATATP